MPAHATEPMILMIEGPEGLRPANRGEERLARVKWPRSAVEAAFGQRGPLGNVGQAVGPVLQLLDQQEVVPAAGAEVTIPGYRSGGYAGPCAPRQEGRAFTAIHVNATQGIAAVETQTSPQHAVRIRQLEAAGDSIPNWALDVFNINTDVILQGGRAPASILDPACFAPIETDFTLGTQDTITFATSQLVAAGQAELAVSGSNAFNSMCGADYPIGPITKSPNRNIIFGLGTVDIDPAVSATAVLTQQPDETIRAGRLVLAAVWTAVNVVPPVPMLGQTAEVGSDALRLLTIEQIDINRSDILTSNPVLAANNGAPAMRSSAYSRSLFYSDKIITPAQEFRVTLRLRTGGAGAGNGGTVRVIGALVGCERLAC